MGWTQRAVGATVLLAMEDHRKRVGARIRQLRERKGLTQDALGDLVGVREKTISRWETGKHTGYISNIEKLAEALEVTQADILGEFPAPLGLGAREAQVDSVAEEFRAEVQQIKDRLDRQYVILGQILAAIGTPESIKMLNEGAKRITALGQPEREAQSEPSAGRASRGRSKRG